MAGWQRLQDILDHGDSKIMNQSVRDYGYADPPTPIGPPKVISFVDAECPNCGCGTIALMKVKMPKTGQMKLLAGASGDPVGLYSGCPACPWASPMMALMETGFDNIKPWTSQKIMDLINKS